MSMKTRLDAHFVAMAAAAGAGMVGVAQNADAAIVYSGVVNVNIPANFTGIYLNMENGAVTNSQVAGWDLNAWVSGGNWVMFPNSAGTGGVVGAAAVCSNLAVGTPINGSSTFITGSANAIPLGSPVILGYRIQNNDLSVHFAWARFNFVNGTTPGTLIDYAYEGTANTAINAGAIPTPGSLSLLALGAVGLIRRRRA